MYWKSFLMVQWEGGLTTGEVRTIEWDNIILNVDEDISEVNIYSTKTKKARTIFVKEATFYLKQLKQEQENEGIKSVYVFPSKSNQNKPIDKTSVSYWFRNLTQKALGKKKWNYLLRHGKATELYELAEQGKISKDTVVRFMGHSKDMSHTYTSLNPEVIKKMLKEQIYKIEDLPEEKKHELEIEIESLKKDQLKIQRLIAKLVNKDSDKEIRIIHKTEGDKIRQYRDKDGEIVELVTEEEEALKSQIKSKIRS